MNTRKLLAVLFTALVLMTSPVFGDSRAERSERETDLYENGTDHIDDEDWDKAIKTFREVAGMNGSHADGALYWMAYAMVKSGRTAEAVQTIEGLKKVYPKSRWIDDAKALALEARQARGERVQPEALDDDELKAMAINSLMHTDPERAYPILEKIVRGPSNKKTKERALFILAQSESPRAQALIADIARGKANPDLQKDAVKYIGIHGGKKSHAVLSELYSSATEDVKKEVLRAFMLSGDKERVYNAAKAEKDLDLRREAIHLLGVMGAQGELASMYASESSRDVKEEIIQGLFISGDRERIGELARSEKDPELRRDAIHKLGLMGGTGALLQELYKDSDIEVKKAVIQSLFLQDNARALINLAKTEKNQELRREALHKLSIMDDEEALQYMLQILEN
ncbi:MAG TPA: HEAT repeat domain-containing protein [Thermoanaerobaculia bacterium]|nr:HEAT repeat domain-containing protein [Thermoanaerobaculia bacterium]